MSELEATRYYNVRAENIAQIQAELSKLRRVAEEVTEEEKAEVSEKLPLKKKYKSRSQGGNYSARVSATSEAPTRRSSRLSEARPLFNYHDLESDEESDHKRKQKKRRRDSSPAQRPVSDISRDIELNNITWEVVLSGSDEVGSLEEDNQDVSYEKELDKVIQKLMKAGDRLPVEEVTDEMLALISNSSCNKTYNKELGTTCHQCRQKTLDMKTVCRNVTCVGIRGQFCGFCLKNRYGQEASAALRDPLWHCPICLGLCTCSICRNASGLKSTGILWPQVVAKGFKCVLDYLVTKEGVPSNPRNFLESHNLQLTYRKRPLKLDPEILVDLCLKAKHSVRDLTIHDVTFLHEADNPFLQTREEVENAVAGNEGDVEEVVMADEVDADAGLNEEISHTTAILIQMSSRCSTTADLDSMVDSDYLEVDFCGFEEGHQFEGFV